MDGRPHFLSVVHYHDLWTAALRPRFRPSPDVCGGAISGKERQVETCADFQSSECRCDTGSKSRVVNRFDGTKKVDKKFDDEEPAFQEDEFEHGLKCGEAENARVQNAANDVYSLKEIRSKETSDSLERSRIRGEDSPQETPAREDNARRRQTVEDGIGIRGQRSDLQAIQTAKQGKEYNGFDGCKTLDGGNLDVTCKDSVDVLHTPAGYGGELARKIAAILGPEGPGLLAVRNVPGVAELRKRLLPLAKRLALMPDNLRRVVLKEHDVNTDVPLKRPDRPVSAFATQLRYGRHDQSKLESCSVSLDGPDNIAGRAEERQKASTENADLPTSNQGEKDEQDLGRILRQLGSLMVEVGLFVARLCDEVCPGTELENAILESGTAKGRLIHYHSQFESNFMSSRSSNGPSKKAPSKVPKALQALSSDVKRRNSEEPASRIPEDSENADEKSEPWQQWHFDYGLLTVLTSPLYMQWEPSAPWEGRDRVTSSVETSTWTHAGGDHSGLIIIYQGVAQCVNIPPDCLVVQVGEAAQILSGGSLAAIPHCVCRAPQADVSRETFVVFLQPSWHRSLSPPSGFDVEEVLQPQNGKSALRNSDGSNRSISRDYRCKKAQHSQSKKFGTHVEIIPPGDPEECRRPDEQWSMHRTELLHAVPPLASRWSDGCTFAEFCKVTTRQYYGAYGRQSQK